MFKRIKKQLFNVIGVVPVTEHNKIQKELEHSKTIAAERDMYKDLAKSIYLYAGNYPVWKAQCEYRQSMDELGHTISNEFSGSHLTRPELIDRYLGNIVDAFAVLYEKGSPDFMQSSHLGCWDKANLSEVRGDVFLTLPTRAVPTKSPDYPSLIEQLSKQAHQSCGLSYELYLRRFQSSVDELIEHLPEDEKETVIALAVKHDYVRDQPD
ncbi:hypothetical protein [Vibrio parahaemolyticus]|uniref:hypothetical protein n=1 Tax=Vibrio parahaemolyticus TaxID=670 RepID=UPI00209C0E71|nr:hypothetical protein [Vibrio parahaemolyticus]